MKQQQRLALPCPRKAKEFLIASPTREIRLCHLLELHCKRDLGFIAWEYRQKAATLQSYRAAYRTTRARVLGCFFELYRTVSPHRLNLRHSVAISMCLESTQEEYELRLASTTSSDQPNNTLVVSQVAERLAEIGDKLELCHHLTRRKDEVALTVKSLCIIAFCIALRVLI